MLPSNYISKWVGCMKKILFFESSHLLQKAIKLILSNTNIYDITIVESLSKYEKESRSHIFDLIISHIDLIKLPISKKHLDFQNVLLMYEKSDSIKEFKDFNLIHFIEKPFSIEEFKKKIDFILGVDNGSENKKDEPRISEQMIHDFAKETVEKWLREEAPKYAKDVIRDEILKLIS
jgi:DNA-binding response OmpR family regulator